MKRTASLVVIVENASGINIEKAKGYGDKAESVTVTGGVMDVKILRDGKAQFGLHIAGDGQVVLTDYGGMSFQTFVPQNLVLTPLRPWGDKKGVAS